MLRHKKIVLNLFPEGRSKALTFSYDDGVTQDRRLVALFNSFGLKGTFHLNSGRTDSGICGDDIRTLYAGHEVAVHSVTHPSLAFVPRTVMMNEVWEDRRNLEAIVGYPVTGMSYPNGSTGPEVIDVLRACGIVYSRTTLSTRQFDFPEEFLLWHPTCHHREALGLLDMFKGFNRKDRPALFYVWGHSYEFDRNQPDNNWDMMEQFCAAVARDETVWYATNSELYRYRQALRSLEFSVDGSLVRNPSTLDVWLTAEGQSVRIPGGALVQLP